jgi:hypothetical protein
MYLFSFVRSCLVDIHFFCGEISMTQPEPLPAKMIAVRLETFNVSPARM